jgi:PadR family transcriptional regulator PadR
MGKVDGIVDGLMLELRRGTIILGVLSQLADQKYGYSLVQSLETKGIAVDAGTLYPLLRRLEKQELLESKWEVTDGRPRRYYVLSAIGSEAYAKLCVEWRAMVASVDELIKNEGGI